MNYKEQMLQLRRDSVKYGLKQIPIEGLQRIIDHNEPMLLTGGTRSGGMY